MWGFESMFSGKEKAKPVVDTPPAEEVISPAAKEEAFGAIAKAKQTGDTHIASTHNPDQYGAEFSVGPKTTVLKSATIAEDGMKSLQIEKDSLEAALQNPVELGGPAKKPVTVRDTSATGGTESLYADPKAVGEALVAAKLPDPIAVKKSPWQPDMFTQPKANVLSPTPMGTAADLRMTEKPKGVEDEWTAARRAAQVAEPEGMKTLRTAGGPVGVEDKWAAAKRAAEGPKSSAGLGEFRTAPKDVATPRETIGGGMTKERKAELRRNSEQMILNLRKMMDGTSDAAEQKSMQARLTMAEKFYDENFK